MTTLIESALSALEGAMPSIASFVVIGFVTFIATKLKGGGLSVKTFVEEHREIVDQQTKNTKTIGDLVCTVENLVDANEDIRLVMRNDVKSHIVSIYERCVERNYITPMELETVNRLNDSYHNTLNGNTYIHVIVRRMNNEMPIQGIEIPEH